MSVSAAPSATTSSRPSRSAEATRSSSWRRSPRSTRMPSCGSGARPAACRHALASAAAVRGSSWASSARSRSASGVRVSSEAMYWLEPEQLGQPLGHLALVAQQPQEPLVAAERLADLPVGQQPGVGVGAGGEGLQQHRQQVLLHRRRPGHPAGERAQVAQRRLGVGEAERAQPVAGRLRPELQLLAGHAGHRRQQRPVEQLLVQPAHLAGVQRQLGLQHVDGAARGRRACSPASGPASAAAGRRWAAGGCGAAGAAAAGARRCAGSGRRRSGWRRPRGRRSRRPTAPSARAACRRPAATGRPGRAPSAAAGRRTRRRAGRRGRA